MNDVIRKTPGYGDMRVAIAADAWGKGDYIVALKEWGFVCDRIDTGCKAYEDSNWVRPHLPFPVASLTNNTHIYPIDIRAALPRCGWCAGGHRRWRPS